MSEKAGRFEYVKRGIVGACAATLLAGLCAAPAFATNITGGATTGSSSVTVKSDIQISATVPTTIGVVLNNDGISVPDASALKIQNTTKNYGISVTNVQATLTGSGFTLSSDGTAPLAQNQIALALDKTGGSSPVYVDTTKKDLAGWAIEASDGTVAKDLTFSLTPTSGTLTKDFFGNYMAAASEALSIQWTVALS